MRSARAIAMFVLAVLGARCGGTPEPPAGAQDGSEDIVDASFVAPDAASAGNLAPRDAGLTVDAAAASPDAAFPGLPLEDLDASIPDAATLAGDAAMAPPDAAVAPRDAGTSQRDAAEPVTGTPACADQDDDPAVGGDRPAINSNPAFLQVYDNNIENLETPGEQCAGEWTDLIAYMKTHTPVPDVFLVQQISNQEQLNQLVQRMTQELPGAYAGIIADENPEPMVSPCGAPKRLQTNAIIYRTARLQPVGDKHVWQSWAFRDGECRRNFQARTRNVVQKFHDVIADKNVTIASLHWSTSQGSGPDPACARMNVNEADEKVHRSDMGGALVMFGGDFNEQDRQQDGDWRPWFSRVNGDVGGALNYRDPIFRRCHTQGAVQSCLDENWTGAGANTRIDFLFAQTREGCRARTGRAHTITFEEGDAAAQELGWSGSHLNYSGHRGVRAEIHY